MTTDRLRLERRRGSFGLVFLSTLLIAMSIMVPARAAVSLGDYGDGFDFVWYGESSGSLAWEPDWIEANDDDSVLSGAFKVGPEAHCSIWLCLIVGKGGGDDASISRMADLSTADSAVLSFQRKRHQHEGGAGSVRLSVSMTGTGGWVTLAEWPLNADDAAPVDEQFDISAWISASTTVRFELIGGTDQAHLNVDNLRIELFEEENLAPVLGSITDATVAEEVPFSFSASATDPNGGDTLTFELDGTEPPGAVITPGGGFTWTPTEAQGPGVYTFSVIVRDDGEPSLSDNQAVTITVEEINAPPVLNTVGDRFVDEGSTLSFTASGTDAETAASELTFSLYGSVPAGAAITDAGLFTWTPTEAQGPGAFTLEVKVWDDGTPALYDFEVITVTVNETNVAPQLAPIANQSVDEGVALSFQAVATDSDLPANQLSYSLAGAPTGASITNGGIFTWTPTDLQGPGSYTFDVVVTDSGSPARTDSESVTVTVAEANIAPVVNPVSPRSVAEGGTLQFSVSASDPDTPANTFVFSLSGAPARATITPGGTFSWSPDENDGPGTYRFDVVATDNGVPAMAGMAEVAVTVTEVNAAPILSSIASQSISEGSAFIMQLVATDSDYPANQLTFSVVNPPAGLAITPGGLITWTPSEAQGPGSYVFDVVVADNGSPQRSDTQQVTFHVSDANNAPVIDPIGTVSGTEGEAISFAVTAVDPDTPANTFWFRLSGDVPAGASITSSGVFGWIPGETQGPGTYTFDVVVTDTGSPARSSSAPIKIVVAEANEAPRLDLLDDYAVEAGLPFLLAAGATDVDVPVQTLSFSASGLPPGAEFLPSGLLTWHPTEDSAGDSHTVRITVTDDGEPALSTTVATKLTVIASNLAPVLDPIDDRVASAGDMVTFIATATDPDGPQDGLVYSLSADAPAGSIIDPASGVFEWRPANVQDHASHKITVRVSDSGLFPKSDSESFTVTVGRPNVAPVLSGLPDQKSLPREAVTLAISGNDPDEYPAALAYAATNLPPGLEIDAVRGIITGEAGFDGLAGSPYIVEISVSDGRDTTSMSLMWEVVGSATPTLETPTRRAVVSRVNEAAAAPRQVAIERSDISRSLVVMASAVRAGVTEMSLPLLYLLLTVGAILALGRIGVAPILQRGKRNEGVLVHFDAVAGSGLVIRKADSAEVFVHSSAMTRRERATLIPGDEVEFRTVDGSYRDVVTRLRKRR